MTTYGGLFEGYGGLTMGVQSVLGGDLAWYSEIEPAPSKILAHHHPDVPNLGDVTKVDWTAVPPVDVITGGSPCQDLSHAGKRAGMRAGTRSGLWASMCDAIDIIRPRLVVWENVRGALSAEADSAVEPCPICVGDGGRVTLRALGRVLGDLAELGYDAWWYGLRAADVGAAHGRFREFLYATPADADVAGLEGLADQRRNAGQERAPLERGGLPPVDLTPGQLTLLPSPRTSDTNGAGLHGTGGPDLRTVAALLPTPRATRGGSSTETRDAPLVSDADHNAYAHAGGSPTLTGAALGYRPGDIARHGRDAQDWREYEAAIRRQEAAFGRPAPLPTETGAKGQPRLSPAFVEWLMGLPEGHVTDPAIGISRNDQLKALGNGVVPQQAAAATRAFLQDSAQAVA